MVEIAEKVKWLKYQEVTLIDKWLKHSASATLRKK